MSKVWLTDEYELAHGRSPRGFGWWAFVPADYVWPGGDMPVDAIAWAHGLYSEAKREVSQRWALVQEWRVLS